MKYLPLKTNRYNMTVVRPLLSRNNNLFVLRIQKVKLYDSQKTDTSSRSSLSLVTIY